MVKGDKLLSQELYTKYQELNIDTSWIGLAREKEQRYFCTPIGAKVIGWDNGIHYCFIHGFGEMVFVVNPDTCCEYYVYPLAKDFTDFLRLLLATKNTNTIQQIILWDKQQYTDFINLPEEVEYASKKEVMDLLDTIHIELGITAMEHPFEYVKKIQKDFDYNQIVFSDEFYDLTGKEKPL